MSPFERPTDASEPGNSPTGRATGRPEQATPISAGQGALGAEYGHERLSLFASSSRGSTLGPAPGARNPRVTLQRSQTGRRRGAGSQGLRGLLGRLSARDISLIDLLAEHRFLTTRHMQAFCFHDHATLTSASRSARRVLGRLAREDLIESPARRVGGMEGGSDAYVWQLTAVGQRLRASRAGLGASTRVRTPSARFIEHYLAIALLEGPPKIDWIASKLDTSRRSLQRSLDAEGCSYSMLLDDLLKDRALTLLASTDQDVTDIALQLGYSDGPHFSRAFRRWTGTAPSRYRSAKAALGAGSEGV